MSIRAVLDTSAILAYAGGSIAVGELIGEFTDEGAQFGLPVLCLVEAATDASPQTLAMLNLLTHHSHAEILPLRPDQWQRTATATAFYGTASRACAALPVIEENAGYVITADPDGYPGLDVIGV
ncbi:MAG: hypothetical protein AUI14_03260 [Actinobacteria bacterium 13_2_20CM_2_71_6]|nr:MAG: hypothetical protein AUI14_03260 [Actinobacteria bacterium 13_2_20CM_2_71_6]